jgi:hypothetical protein
MNTFLAIFFHGNRERNKQNACENGSNGQGMVIGAKHKQTKKQARHVNDNKHDGKDEITKARLLWLTATGR